VPKLSPLHGQALVLIPSTDEVIKNYIRIMGGANMITVDQIDFLVTMTENSHQFIADAIKARNIFNSVTVDSHSGNPALIPVENYNYLIYLDVDGWFIKGRGEKLGRRIPYDQANSQIVSQTLTFLESLEQLAK
jgi:hypothetical protein